MRFAVLLVVLVSAFQTVADTTLIIRHTTRYTTLADKYYYSVYFDTLLKAYNRRTGELLHRGDTVVIPDLDSLLNRCQFAALFKDEVDRIDEACTYQTTMYTYQLDAAQRGLGSLVTNAKTGAAILVKAIDGIKSTCDSLKYAYPKSVLSQLNSAAKEMLSYADYLSHSGTYASKNIYVQNLHMSLWKMYAALWCLNGFR